MHHIQSETLPQSVELYQLIVENLKDHAILMTDSEGYVSSCNPDGEKILGYSEAELAGQSIAVIYPPEELAANIPAIEMETALAENRSENKGWRRRRDGTRFWATTTAMPVKNTDGSLRGFAVLIRDETARKLTEDKLEQTNQRLENILSSLADSFYTVDRELRYVYVNEATTKMFDLPEEEFIGKTLWEVFPDAEGNNFHAQVVKALNEQKTIVFENYYAPLNRWFENRIYPSPGGLSLFTAEITERKLAEKALRASEERYRTLFNSIDEGFCVIEVLFDAGEKAFDYRFLESNPSFAALTGLPEEDVLRGKTARELVPDLEQKWFENYGRVALTGEPCRFVEGSEAMSRWFDVYAFRVGNPEERRVAVLFNNITESKKAEIALREAEQRYRALVEATATTVWHANPEGSVSFLGDVLTGDGGTGAEENSKWGWLDAIHPDDRERTRALWKEALQNKTLYSTELRILTAPDTYRWFAASAVPIFDAEGRLREWIGSNLDIHERRQAEEEREQMVKQLETERSRLAYIFEQAPAFVAIMLGEAHVFALTNPAYLQLIGHRNVVGKPVREALPDISGQGYFELLDKVYQTGEPFIGHELPVKFQSAAESAVEQRFVNFVFQPIFRDDRQVAGIFMHGVDITGQVQARREAENANRLKDEFLATLSHELRTPLNAILGWSQLLKNQIIGENERQMALETITRSARAQNQLIDDLLDISRIITGKLRLDVRAVDLPDVITGAVEAARPAAEAKNIRLQTLLDPQADPVSGDPDRLQQVVWNLLSNAIKFTPKDGRVQIRLERINSHVEIVVSDTGRGIEPEFLPFVFDRFRQSDGSTTRLQGGLGIGLAIVRQLVEQHGGTVSVASEGPGKGATFTVKLPLLPVRREPAGERRVHPAAKQTEKTPDCPPELAGLHVLVVDDEEDSRDLINQMLSLCGAQITAAASAAEAFEIIRQEKFDIIVSDIGMPEEDGFSLISRIRKLPADQGGQTPAIALTAYARAEDRIQSIRAGFQMHIAKPVEPSELLAVVASYTGRA